MPEVIPYVKLRADLDPRDRYNIQTRAGVVFDLQPGWRVLDVGPMCFPFPHATHYLGVDPRDDPKDGKPFTLADIQERTPFEDGYFDYVYCSHVLEHVDDPVAAAAELSRIGQRGYVEVPSGFSTLFLFYGTVHPKWFPWQDEDGTLIFCPWDKRVLEAYSEVKARHAVDRIVNGNPAKEKLTQRELALRSFYYDHLDIIDPRQMWEGQVRIRLGHWFQ